MLSQSLFVIASLASLALGQGYVLPTSGTASTTQFLIEEEFGSGTSCGQKAFPNNKKGNGQPGGGPGYLYVDPPTLKFLRIHILTFDNRPPSTSSPLVQTPAPAPVDLEQHAVFATS